MDIRQKKVWLALALTLLPPPLSLGYAYLGLWKRWAKVFFYCLLAWFFTGVTPWTWDSAAGFFLCWALILVDVRDRAMEITQQE